MALFVLFIHLDELRDVFIAKAFTDTELGL
jgi:hypothetical protein